MKFTLVLTILALIVLAVSSSPLGENELETCRTKCVVFYDYTPLCASDGTEYPNESSFECDKKCGKILTILATSADTFEECTKKCAITLDLRPVCGTDGLTYDNLSELNCRRGCGTDVSLRRKGACSPGSKGAPSVLDFDGAAGREI